MGEALAAARRLEVLKCRRGYVRLPEQLDLPLGQGAEPMIGSSGIPDPEEAYTRELIAAIPQLGQRRIAGS